MKAIKCLVVSLLVVGSMAVVISSQPTEQMKPNARQMFKLPKLFEFGEYQRLFGKIYRSASEQLVRQKLFLARAFRAFISGMRYKFNLQSYYLRINGRSDQTPEELEASKLKPGIRLFGDYSLANTTESANRKQPISRQEEDDMAKLEYISEEQIEAKLKEITNEHADEPGYAKIAAELKGSNGSRRKRQAITGLRELSLDDLAGRVVTQEEPGVVAKIVRNPTSNNPSYEQPELLSFGLETAQEPLVDISFSTVVSEADLDKASDALSSLLSKLANQLSSFMVGDTTTENSDKKVDGEHKKELTRERSEEEFKLNEVFLDHRKSNCFFKVRDQGKCGSCYAFAFVSQIEWMHCMETGELLQFSEQYIVDCGDRAGLRGCDGGEMKSLAIFAQNFGLELGLNYPYRGVKEMCPYGDTTEKEKMGFMRINIRKSAIVDPDAFGEFLNYSPMVVGVATKNTNFEEYGGGVATGKNCPKDEDHAMLLVGHGREDGIEYWLLRNSHSPSFGEDGYYKLAKSSGCIRTPGFIYGSVNGREFKISPIKNSNYDENLMKSGKTLD